MNAERTVSLAIAKLLPPGDIASARWTGFDGEPFSDYCGAGFESHHDDVHAHQMRWRGEGRR